MGFWVMEWGQSSASCRKFFQLVAVIQNINTARVKSQRLEDFFHCAINSKYQGLE